MSRGSCRRGRGWYMQMPQGREAFRMPKQQRGGPCDYRKGGSGEEMNWVRTQKQLPWSPESQSEGCNFIPCAIPLRGCKQGGDVNLQVALGIITSSADRNLSTHFCQTVNLSAPRSPKCVYLVTDMECLCPALSPSRPYPQCDGI